MEATCLLNSVRIIQSWVRGRLRYFAAKRSGANIIICMCAEYSDAERLKRQALLYQLMDTKQLLRSCRAQGVYIFVLSVLVYQILRLMMLAILPNIACRAALPRQGSRHTNLKSPPNIYLTMEQPTLNDKRGSFCEMLQKPPRRERHQGWMSRALQATMKISGAKPLWECIKRCMRVF